jgi:hypothetical protein
MPVIAVTHVKQTKQNWCWAACSEMLARRCGVNVSQSDFALAHNARYHHGLDHMADQAETAALLRDLAQRSVDAWRHIGLNADPRLTWQQACAALDRCQLMIAGASNHDYLVVGYDTDPNHGQILWVHDPSRDTGPNKAKWDVFTAANWNTTVILNQYDTHVLV